MPAARTFPTAHVAVRTCVAAVIAVAVACPPIAAAQPEPGAGSASGSAVGAPREPAGSPNTPAGSPNAPAGPPNAAAGAPNTAGAKPAERGVLGGRVVMADGRPAVSATVSVDPVVTGETGGSPASASAGAASHRGEGARVETDDAGLFRIEGLAARTYEVTAVALTGERAVARLAIDGERQLELRLTGAVAGETIEVRGRSAAEERRQSAEAVTVVDTEQAKRGTADLGEVLARTQGVSVRRTGGLGSNAALSLAGLTGEQIRLFLDGIPLAAAGFPFGVANVPVNLIDRVEVYNGVVPVRYGADALGGAVNLVTNDAAPGTHGAASLEAGSFDTERMTLSARHRTARGLYARVDGFLDHTRNDYVVTARESNSLGQLTDVEVHKFHDGYEAGGGAVELGAVNQPWAQRLALRGFASGSDKQYQSDPLMQRVYGEVTGEERTAGGSARYQQAMGAAAVEAVAGYVFTRDRFRDVSTCAYNWFGQCFTHNGEGEIDDKPHDERTWDHTAFARVHGSWTVRPHHGLRLSVAPSYTTRSGDDRAITMGRDPLSAERTLGTVVSGLEYQVDVLGDRLENVAFLKHYAQWQRSEDPEPGGRFVRRDRDTQRPGFGDALRYRFRDALYAKLSYEWATRLPTAGEVFGDNAFLAPNLALEPETSHNLNAGLALDALDTPAGTVSANATWFLRSADRLIQRFAINADESYQNVFGGRAVGVELSGGWTPPGGYVVLDGTATYQSFRNTSSDGPYGTFEGDRIPNQPFLFGSGAARLQLRDQIVPHDEISLSYTVRYTHAFDRDWASLGASDHVVPTQWLHTVGAGYRVRGERTNLAATLEVTNLTDEPLFDYYRVQRPGRALYVKTSVDF